MLFFLPLILYVIAIFLTLWIADLYFTVKSVSKLGEKIEVNPIIRSMLKLKGKHIWAYKVVEIGIFGICAYVLYFRWIESFKEAQSILFVLFGLIFIYALLVAQGLNVYSQIYRRNKAGAILLLLFVFYTLFFVNLNYNLFSNNVSLSNELSSCNKEYVNVYSECKGIAPPKDFTKKFDLNLLLPGV